MIQQVSDYAQAFDLGKTWNTIFRKTPTIANLTSQWVDYMYFTGNPIPNYYASSPLVAATLDRNKGLYHGPQCSPDQKFLQKWTMQIGASSATSTTTDNMTFMLLDYVLYYPFIDMDNTDIQEMDNTVTLPRYTDGKGLKIMMVSLQPTTGSGSFSLSYTNQDGTTGRTTGAMLNTVAAPQGTIISAQNTTAAYMPFLRYDTGDYGVQKIDSITYTAPNGGLCALVIVKPIAIIYCNEAGRRTTTGTIESFGDTTEINYLSHKAGVSTPIHDNAFLGLIALTPQGSISGSQIAGNLEFFWG